VSLIKEHCTKVNDWKVFPIGIINNSNDSYGTVNLCDECA